MPGQLPKEHASLLFSSTSRRCGTTLRWAVATGLFVASAILLLEAASSSSSSLSRTSAPSSSASNRFGALWQDHPAKAAAYVVPDADMMWQAELMRSSMLRQADVANPAEEKRREEEEHLVAAQKAQLARQVAEEAAKKKEDKVRKEEERRKDEEKEALKRRETWVAHQEVKHETGESVLIGALTDLLGPPSPEEAAVQTALREKRRAEWEKQWDARWKAKQEKKAKEAAEVAKREREKREKEEKEKQAKLEAAEEAKRQRKAAKVRAKKLREHKLKMKEEKLKNKLKKEKEEREKKQNDTIKAWQDVEATSENVTLYCFALMMPFGYEPELLAKQRRHHVGIYGCDEHAVFSNMTTLLNNGAPSPVEMHVVPGWGALAVAYGGRWMTAMNTGVFNKLWMEVIKLGRYRYHDWTIKADPDTVFFPARLCQLLRHTKPFNQVHRKAPEPASFSKCGNCGLPDHTHETCAAHVRWWQKQGKSCSESLTLTAREAPMDCGCDCDDFACDMPEAAIYLNNCKWGLHGPIEVLSRRAVATYAAGLPRCVDLLSHPWGEDKFLDQCMQQLGVTRTDEYSVLSETACGEQPAPCGTANVAFHPFKSIQSWFTCHAYASKYGEGPAAEPHFDADAQDGADDDEETDEELPVPVK